MMDMLTQRDERYIILIYTYEYISIKIILYKRAGERVVV